MGHIAQDVTWRGTDLRYIIRKLGLATSVQIILDAGCSDSYSSGQTWTDLTGGGSNFTLGADGSATSTDPTFNGTAGRLTSSEYFSLDGGDYFRIGSNTTFINGLHRNNAVWSFACWAYLSDVTAANHALMGTSGFNTTNHGVGFRWNTTDALRLVVHNASGSAALDVTAAFTISANTWTFFGVSIDESVGANGLRFVANAQTSLATSTFSSPSASNATNALELGAGGSGAVPLLSGSRFACAAFWSRALSAAEFASLYRITRTRFGV